MASTNPVPQPGGILPVGNILSDFKHVRNIPQVLFLEDLTQFLADNKVTVEPVLESLQIMFQKYKSYETQLLHNRSRYKTQIPDIEASLGVVKDLVARTADGSAPFNSHFLLTDNVYARAEITPQNKVGLWLGANVMIEYTYAEAMELLANNLSIAKEKAGQTSEDLSFVRDQVVITQVNMARVFNYDVMQRRAAKKAGGPAAIESGKAGGQA